MREIKFRGKSKKDGKWLYGYLGESKFKILNTEYSERVIFDNVWEFNSDNCAFIVKDLAVDPETIGQFTGINDINNNSVYEGDLVRVMIAYTPAIFQVLYAGGAFCLADKDGLVRYGLDDMKCEVVGDLWDTPELLEETK